MPSVYLPAILALVTSAFVAGPFVSPPRALAENAHEHEEEKASEHRHEGDASLVPS
jgi:hypothetical protein